MASRRRCRPFMRPWWRISKVPQFRQPRFRLDDRTIRRHRRKGKSRRRVRARYECYAGMQCGLENNYPSGVSLRFVITFLISPEITILFYESGSTRTYTTFFAFCWLFLVFALSKGNGNNRVIFICKDVWRTSHFQAVLERKKVGCKKSKTTCCVRQGQFPRLIVWQWECNKENCR